MNTIQHKKFQKPIDFSINLIYRCPNCANQHWLTLNQVKNKKFIVVCDCDCVFKVKPVENIKVLYQKKIAKTQVVTNNHQPLVETKSQPVVESKVIIPPIPESLLDSCVKTLKPYGFTTAECTPLIIEFYNKNPKYTALEIIKLCFNKLGGKNG